MAPCLFACVQRVLLKLVEQPNLEVPILRRVLDIIVRHTTQQAESTA